MENKKNTPRKNNDWENRRLCSDPACIGVIGADGRCKECGKPYEGDPFEDTPFAPSLSGAGSEDVEPAGATFRAEPDVSADDYEDAELSDEDETPSDDDWKNRKLCSDPACIGVIGPDGRCKECGKPLEGE